MITDEGALRVYVGRIIGWTNTDGIEQALRSIHLAVTYRAVLVLLGQGHLVPLARALHRLTLGNAPFVMCDARRGSSAASIRAPANYESGVDAFRAADGGTLCIRETPPPRDLALLAALSRDPAARVQIIVTAWPSYEIHPFLFRPSPIVIPQLTTRVREIPRIIEEYATDAIVELSAESTGFAASDRAWVAAIPRRRCLKSRRAPVGSSPSDKAERSTRRLGGSACLTWRSPAGSTAGAGVLGSGGREPARVRSRARAPRSPRRVLDRRARLRGVDVRQAVRGDRRRPVDARGGARA